MDCEAKTILLSPSIVLARPQAAPRVVYENKPGRLPKRFAILLPVTSRGSGPRISQELELFLHSFQDTVFVTPAGDRNGQQDWQFEFFVVARVGP
jgi:hypothetical protein